MANSLLQPNEITRIPLMVAHTNIKFAKAVDKSYGEEFANDTKSMAGKIGKTIQIRLPNKYTIRSGTAMQVQAHTEQSTALTVGTEIGIDSEFYDSEEALNVSDYEKRYAMPMGLGIAAEMDRDLASMYNLISNAVLLDTTSAATQVKTILQAKQKLIDANMPIDDKLSAVMGSAAEPFLASNLVTIYNPQPNISKVFKEGRVSDMHGMSWYTDQNMPIHTCGTRVAGSGTTCGATITAEGQTYINLKNASNQTVAVGDVFTLGTTVSNPVYGVNPETKKSTGALAQFVVQPGTDGAQGYVASTQTYTLSAGGVNVNVFINGGAIYTSASLGLQNVLSMPASTALATFIGVASTAYSQIICLHETAAALASVKLPVWPNQGKMERSSYDGMSLRYWRNGDITNGRQLSRFDSLYGKAMPRPDWATRLYVALS
jgi:hypothetical protein